MRWLVRSFLKKARERRGHRPIRVAAPAPLGLERLEDRRLLSATAALQPVALLDASHATPPAVVASSTPSASSASSSAVAAGAASASSSSVVSVTAISGSNLDSLDWQAEAVYRTVFANYLATTANQNAAASPTTPPSAAASSGTASSSSSAAAAPAPSSSSSSPATSNASSAGDSTNNASPSSTSGQTQSSAAATSPSSTTDSADWQAEAVYRVVFADYFSMLVRARLNVAPEPSTAPATTAAPSDASPSSAPAVAAPEPAPSESVLTVEISVAADPESPTRTDSSAPAPETIPPAALRLSITPPVAGPEGAWSLNLTVAPIAADGGSVAPDGSGATIVGVPAVAGQGGAASSVGFLFLNITITWDAPGATTSSAPSSGTAPAAEAGSRPGAVTAATSTGPSAAVTSASNDSAPAPVSSGPSVAASVVADLVLSEWSGPGAGPAFAGAAAVVSTAEWMAAVSSNHTPETPVLTAEQWAALSEAVKQALTAGAAADSGLPDAPIPATVPSSIGGVHAAGVPAWAGPRVDRHWAWMGAPFALVGGMFLPAFGVGRAGAPATAAGADAASPVALRVAESVKEYTESLTGLVTSLYRTLLGRNPLNGEEQGWVGALVGGQTEEQFLEAFLATAEFTQRATALGGSGLADAQYIRGLFPLLMQRPADAEEVGAWLAVLPEIGRDGVVACLVRSNEFRTLQVQGFYLQVYGEPADPADAAAWAASPLHLLAIREAI